MSVRLARLALVVLIVGLALHNLAMALLWDAGVRDTALDVVAGWKDVLLLVALAAALVAARSLPTLHWADRLALAYGAIVVVYWLLPQSWLDGEATARGELYALRHHLLPLGAYLLGRLLPLDRTWWRRIGLTLVGVACGLAVWGLVDVYLVPLETWRDSGVPGWFEEQLGLAYAVSLGPAGELDPQHRRGEPGPAARLDVPEPARDRLRARRRPPAARGRASAALDDRRRRRRVRRASLHAHPRGLPRARRRAPRARGAPALVDARGARGRIGRRSRSRSSPSSRRSGRRRPTRRPSSRACARTPPRRAIRAAAPSTPARARPRATGARSATGSAPSPSIRGDSGSGTPASRRHAPVPT